MAKSSSPGTTGSTHIPLSTPNVRSRKEPKAPRSWGYISEPAPAQPEAAEAVASVVAKAPVKPRTRTFIKMMDRHKRPDGKTGFTYRDLCPKLNLAAESLRAARIDPGRLTLNAVVTLAGLMGEDPLLVLADIMAEIKHKPKRKTEAAKVARAGKAKEEAQALARA